MCNVHSTPDRMGKRERARCQIESPFRVNRVIPTTVRSLPFPSHEQTFFGSSGVSQKTRHNQTSPSRIHRYPSCFECVASPRTAEDLAPVIFREGDWNSEGWSTLRSCTLPTTRPTLYAEWTDIELVRELSPGRAEVPVSYWQRRCRRQASHFNRPTSF